MTGIFLIFALLFGLCNVLAVCALTLQKVFIGMKEQTCTQTSFYRAEVNKQEVK